MVNSSLISPSISLHSATPKSTDTILTSSILLSQFIFWGVWYWACLLSVIPFGRIWCGAFCPLGAISQWVGFFGLKRNLPRWVKWDGWLVIMFIVITLLGQTLDVRDDPEGMIKLFGMIFLLAIVIGFLYGKNQGRPWCRYFCPIGKILGVVARLGIIDIRPNNGAKDLPINQKLYKQGKLCPTDYNLPYKVSNNNCIACGKCTFKRDYLKKNKKSGMGVYLRKPGSEVEDIMRKDPKITEVIFLLLSPGISAGGFLWLILNQYQQMRDSIGSWALNNDHMWIFNQASWIISSRSWNQNFNWLDIFSIFIYMMAYGLIIGFIIALLIGATSLIVKSKNRSLKKDFIYLSYQITPLSILSIVIGLSGKFFTTFENEFNMPSIISVSIKIALFSGSIGWSIYLFAKAFKNIKPNKLSKLLLAWVCIAVLIGVLVAIWFPAIFNYTYMSEVEKIRKHIVLP